MNETQKESEEASSEHLVKINRKGFNIVINQADSFVAPA